ncbi:ROK family protein [Stackebrandtia nassauensis]|nr:ROK family protein [Stackebrandtia nassauensis]
MPSTKDSAASRPRRGEAARWQTAVDVLRLVRRQPGITRAAAAQTLRLSSSSATEVTTRLRQLHLVEETVAATTGRGRPTGALRANPDGPTVAVVNIRHEDFQIAVVDLDGTIVETHQGRHTGDDPAGLIARLRTDLREVRDDYGFRLRAVSIVVAGTVSSGRLVQASTLDWHDVDLGALDDGHQPRLPILMGNDATLAGVAEARRGSGRDSRTMLYLTIEVGVGGVLIDNGVPAAGATGAGGEFGHLPFGDRDLACPCGARGCWDLEVDGRAMARHRGDRPPHDPRSYAVEAMTRADGDPATTAAVRRCATAFGSGVAGLVNALDPDTVVLGGLAPQLRQLFPDAVAEGFDSGLMVFRRASPPPLLATSLGAQAAVLGAAEVAFDAILTATGLAEWAAQP